MPVAAPADRRFRRARVKPVRRRRAWPRRVVRAARLGLPAVALAVIAWFAAQIVVNARALHVDTIRVKGNVHLTRAEVMELLAGLEGRHILLTDLEPWRRRMLRSPWVAQAAVRRTLPSTIEVTVLERTPMGLGRLGAELYLVDGAGTIIEKFGPQYADFDLPIIDGLGATEGEAPSVDPTRAALADRLLAELGGRGDLIGRVSQIDVSNPRDAVLLLENDTALLHLGNREFSARLEKYLDLADTLRERVPAIEYVDLRFDDRLYVRPAARGRRNTGAQP
jgi:cell division protein FtsQ